MRELFDELKHTRGADVIDFMIAHCADYGCAQGRPPLIAGPPAMIWHLRLAGTRGATARGLFASPTPADVLAAAARDGTAVWTGDDGGVLPEHARLQIGTDNTPARPSGVRKWRKIEDGECCRGLDKPAYTVTVRLGCLCEPFVRCVSLLRQGKSLKVFVPGRGVIGRLLSPGLAALQGFPESYAPRAVVCESVALRQIADAVPPPLGAAILRASLRVLRRWGGEMTVRM